MFIGTINKLVPSKTVYIETHYLNRFKSEYLSNDCFSLIIIEKGSLILNINNTDCHIVGPAALCLDESKKVKVLSDSSSGIRMIKFNPCFLNVNMSMDTIRSNQYNYLCQQHSFFQLSPFLTEQIEKTCIRLDSSALLKIIKSFDNLTKNLEEQSDWYWSCRARSYFIDIINILERIYHNFYIEEPYESCMKIAISNEFKVLLIHINTHLEEKITLDSLYALFHINKNQIENLFKEFLGTTFYDYLKTRRYEEASYYLRFTELGGEEIASRIGLSSSQNFCKFFKANSGMSPNSFRKEMVTKRKQDPELLSQFIRKNI